MMINGRDIHDVPAAQWPRVDPALLHSVVEVRVVCLHGFGLGVELVGHAAYGHVDIPNVTDGRYDPEDPPVPVGEVRKAVVVAMEPGRQPKLSLRESRLRSVTGQA